MTPYILPCSAPLVLPRVFLLLACSNPLPVPSAIDNRKAAT